MAKPAYLSVKNYEKYQHYKDRNPPWVKLYWDLLSDDKFVMLSMSDRGLYSHFLLLASRHDNYIPFDLDYIQLQLKMLTQPDLTRLIHDGFLLARCKRGASITLDKSALPSTEIRVQSSELEREKEKNKITSPDGDLTKGLFNEFWEAYPKRNGKKIGRDRSRVLFTRLSSPDQQLALKAAGHYGRSDAAGRGYSKDPERFLKADYWREWIEPETTQAKKLAYTPVIKAFMPKPPEKVEPMPDDVREMLGRLSGSMSMG